MLNFRQSERIVTEGEEELVGSFLFTTNTAHDIAFVKGPDAKLHHAAFGVDSLHDVFKAADILSMYEVPFDVTPTRHGISRGQTIYFFDPSGNRNEAFAGGYMAFGICLRSHGMHQKLEQVFSITAENYLNPL